MRCSFSAHQEHFDGPAIKVLAPAMTYYRWGKGPTRWTVEMQDEWEIRADFGLKGNLPGKTEGKGKGKGKGNDEPKPEEEEVII